MKIGVIGLGLIGGSIAKAIKYNTDHSVYGCDINRSTVLKAKLLGSIDEEMTDDLLSRCDLLVLALYPRAAVDYLSAHGGMIRKGAIVLDTCGVKRAVCDPCRKIAAERGFTFIGAHPMAGREFSGFENSRVTLFQDASMIIVPEADTPIQVLDVVQKLFLRIGFTHIQRSTPEEHDRIIAYTSQLAHVVSNAYVKSDAAEVHAGFSAGSYKDLTRVAKLDERMWTELFLDNAENLADEIDGLAARLAEYSQAIKARDAARLAGLLRDGRLRKERIDGLELAATQKA